MIKFIDLCKYYKDCNFEEARVDICAKVQKENKSYVRLEAAELSMRDPMGFTDVESIRIRDLIERSPQNAVLWYGYPCSVTKRADGEYIKPLFCLPIKYDQEKKPIFELGSPLVNADALEDFNIGFEAIKRFAEEVGGDGHEEKYLTFTDLAEKLKAKYPNLIYDYSPSRNGMVSRGIVISSEPKPYTQGLDKELTALIAGNPNSYKDTSLNCFIGDYYDNHTDVKNLELNEVFELNENQRKAVQAAFNQKLTVIIGPPGTGKSQVVASIVVNAALNNKRVLLASRNRKAIQVVENKLNKFADQPFIIRLGNIDGERDLRRPLIEYMQRLISSHPDPSLCKDLTDEETLIKKCNDRRREILRTLEELREKRNTVLNHFNYFEKNVGELDPQKSRTALRMVMETNTIQKRCLLNRRYHITAQYVKLLNDLHKLKYFENVIDELDKINCDIAAESKRYFQLWLKTLPLKFTDEQRRSLAEYIAVLDALTDSGLSIADTYELKNRKNELMAGVSDFLHAWCVTNLSTSGQIPLVDSFFDIVVIDEASQCDIASAIPLLFRAKRAVIIGDPFQLKHITRMSPARSNDLKRKNSLTGAVLYDYVKMSLFDLAHSKAKADHIIQLNEHFRSHADIITFSQQMWYDNNLLISTDYRNLDPQLGEKENAIEWIDVKGQVKQIENSGAYIPEEVNAVVKKTKEILDNKNFKGEIGIVSPFRHQVNKIRDRLNRDFNEKDRLRILVDSTVNFQGDEKDVIIYSCVMGEDMPPGAAYYLRDTQHLLNVAVTRAQAKLFVVGNKKACLECDIPHISKFANYVAQLERGIIRTIEEKAESPYEKILYEAMIQDGLKPIPQYVVGQYRLDFALLSGDRKIDIEVDGKEFHTDWTGERLKSDILRNHRLQHLGWKVLRLWSYEIRDQIEYCIERIVHEIEISD